MKTTKELLEEINGNVVNIAKYKGNPQVVTLVQYGFDDNFKFLLPEGTPPYREDGIPDGFGFSNLIQEMRKFYVLIRKDLKPTKREGIFITMLESLDPAEREILLMIKEQTLYTKYPNLTKINVQPLLDVL